MLPNLGLGLRVAVAPGHPPAIFPVRRTLSGLKNVFLEFSSLMKMTVKIERF